MPGVAYLPMRFLIPCGLSLLAMSPCAAQTIVVDTAACRALVVAHQPADDVALKPGVDVRGRPVAPAELAAPTPVLAPNFTFDLNADLAPFLAPGSRLFQPQLNVGRVTIAPDGNVAFNGRPLAATDAAALATVCRRAPR